MQFIYGYNTKFNDMHIIKKILNANFNQFTKALILLKYINFYVGNIQMILNNITIPTSSYYSGKLLNQHQ